LIIKFSLLKQYFQLNIDINQDQQSSISSIRRELLLDYLQYRSEVGKNILFVEIKIKHWF
jgi:hypothetical protein